MNSVVLCALCVTAFHPRRHDSLHFGQLAQQELVASRLVETALRNVVNARRQAAGDEPGDGLQIARDAVVLRVKSGCFDQPGRKNIS